MSSIKGFFFQESITADHPIRILVTMPMALSKEHNVSRVEIESAFYGMPPQRVEIRANIETIEGLRDFFDDVLTEMLTAKKEGEKSNV